jgi:hypothetical protein
MERFGRFGKDNGVDRMRRFLRRTSEAYGPKTNVIPPGPPLGAAQFQGAEGLTAPQGGALPTLSPTGGQDMAVSFFLAIDTMPAAATLQEVIRCMSTAAGLGGWQIQLNGTTQSLRWQTRDTGVLQAPVDLVTVLPTQEWMYCNFSFDNSGGAANISIFIQGVTSGVLVNIGAGSSFCGPVHTNPLQMGTGAAFGLQGRLSRVGVWLPVGVSPPDVSYLYNGGVGRTGAEVVASGPPPVWGDPTDLRGYWDLNEQTGAAVWPDTTGFHDAAASGTIVSVNAPPTY